MRSKRLDRRQIRKQAGRSHIRNTFGDIQIQESIFRNFRCVCAFGVGGRGGDRALRRYRDFTREMGHLLHFAPDILRDRGNPSHPRLPNMVGIRYYYSTPSIFLGSHGVAIRVKNSNFFDRDIRLLSGAGVIVDFHTLFRLANNSIRNERRLPSADIHLGL